MDPLPIGRHAALETPSGLAARLRLALAGLGGGWVEGEVRGLRVSSRGHAYLDICDADATLHCVVWRGTWQGLRPRPEEGALVQARFGRVDLYPPSGNLALVLEEVRATGEGELLRRQAETLARLAADGLLDASRKPPLPRFPRRVGIVAGADSDALADVVKAIRDRFPPQRLVVETATVQGASAVDSLIGALARLIHTPGVDAIVVARGGGSVQDLHPFSDERLCRAIAACPVPVVTSIGHAPAAELRPRRRRCGGRARPHRRARRAERRGARAADRRARPAHRRPLGTPARARGRRRQPRRRAHPPRRPRSARRGRGPARRRDRRAPAALPALLDGPRARLDAAARARRRAARRRLRPRRRARAARRRRRDAPGRARAGERLTAAHGLVAARDALGRGFAAVLRADGTAVPGAAAIADGERLRLVLKDGAVAVEARLEHGDGRGA